MMRIPILSLLLVLLSLCASGQKYPERRPIRQGNRAYGQERYSEGEAAYRRALERTPASFEATWNLGKSLYKQQRWDEAARAIAPLAADSTRMEHSAAAWYDLAGALFQQRKLQQALEAYKQSLRLDPANQQTKFNLAYVQKLLENEQDKNDGTGGSEQPEPQPQPQNDEQPQNSQNGEHRTENGPEEQQPPNGMTRQEAEQLLDAMQTREDQWRTENGERKPAVGNPDGKNW